MKQWPKARESKKKSMNNEIMKMIDEWRKSKQDRDAHETLNRQMKPSSAMKQNRNSRMTNAMISKKNHTLATKLMYARVREETSAGK